jgi:hypothetical protein
MRKKFSEKKSEIDRLLREEFGNYTDVGVAVFSTTGGNLTPSSVLFSYIESVAVAALIKKNYEPIFAAALVYNGVVYSTPHFPGRSAESPLGTDPVGQRFAGVYRLPDGSLWAVHADNDVQWVKPDELSSDFVVFATRGPNITDEDPADRVRHLLTKCDEVGQLSEAA